LARGAEDQTRGAEDRTGQAEDKNEGQNPEIENGRPAE
jgi:hypothetical protein